MSNSPAARPRRRILLWVLAIVIVLAIAAWFILPRIYAATQEGAADPEPTISAGSSSSESADASDPAASDAAAPAAGEWQVSDGSFAGYRVEEVLNGADVSVTGRTEQVSGSVVTTDQSVTEATIEVDVASIATDEAARDTYFTGTALETDAFPTATFTLTEPVLASADAVDGSTQDVQLVGDLTIHGVTQSVTVDAQVAIGADAAQVVGSIPITFSDFGVEAPSLGFVSVEDAGAVEFSLQLSR